MINYEAEVSKTKIFVSGNKDSTRQLIVYSNNVDTTKTGNAMILPVPHPESLEFYDLSSKADFFTVIERYFRSTMMSNARGRSIQTNSLDTLKVIDVGSYQLSICQNLNDFDRINTTVFTLNPSLKNILAKYYTDFGFLVCKLRNEDVEYHPLAYSHNIFKPGLKFVPTRHYHSGKDEEPKSHWDHTIYSTNSIMQHREAEKEQLPKISMTLKQYIPEFEFPELERCERKTINGYSTNEDMYIYSTSASDFARQTA